jgi:hypothetical protein
MRGEGEDDKKRWRNRDRWRGGNKVEGRGGEDKEDWTMPHTCS